MNNKLKLKKVVDLNIIQLDKGDLSSFGKEEIFYDEIFFDILSEKNNEKDIDLLILTSNHNRYFNSSDYSKYLKKIIEIYKDSKKFTLLCTIDFHHIEKIKELINMSTYFGRVNVNYTSFISMVDDIREEGKYHYFHGTLLSIYDEGVLIKGPAGIGKSELAISLLKKGHFLVSDDAVNIFYSHGRLVGHPSNKVSDFIEVRGIGIVNVKKTFGIQHIIPNHTIDLIVELEHYDPKKSNRNRLSSHMEYQNILGVETPKLNLYLSPGKSLTDLVEVAIINEKHRKYENYIGVEDFVKILKK